MRYLLRNPRTRLGSLLLAACLLLGGAPALAGRSVEGKGGLIAIHASTLTLEIEDDLRIKVTDDTRIYDLDERRIHFRQIPDPAHGQVFVRYAGRLVGSTVQATRLVVGYDPQ